MICFLCKQRCTAPGVGDISDNIIRLPKYPVIVPGVCIAEWTNAIPFGNIVGERVIRMDRSDSSYHKSFDISAVDTDRINAKYVDDVPHLILSELEQPLPEDRFLEIEKHT